MSNDKNKTSKAGAKTKIATWFQSAWIWFKETAWIQVLLVVLLVFAIVFSIPFIVRAVNTQTDESVENIDYLDGKQVDYDGLKKKVEDTSNEYTVVFFYSGSDTDSQTLGGYLRDYIFNSKYFDYEDFEDHFVTLDISATDKADKDDYDITEQQIVDLANIYRPFYNNNIYEKAYYTYKGSRAQLFTDEWGTPDSGELTISPDTWVIYRNGENALENNPAWINIGWNNLSTLQDFMHEFEASMNYAFDTPIIELKSDVTE